MEDDDFTVFVRVPIPRGEFVDPPPVKWDSSKDESLWKILSGAAQTEIDWNQAAEQFDVPVNFLLRQVAFLTERHASQVREQVRKATAAAKGGSSAPSPIPGSDSVAGVRSIRRESPTARNDGSGAGTPMNSSTRPGVSRNTSASTAVLSKDAGGSSSPRPGSSSRPAAGIRAGDGGGRRRLSSLPISSTPDEETKVVAEPEPERSPSPGPAEEESSTTTDSEDESSPAQSRIIRRPPRLAQRDASNAYEGDDDDESEPAFQPYKPPATETQTSAQDLTSTLRGDGKSSTSKRGVKNTAKAQHAHQSHTSDSDNSSAPLAHRPGKSREQKPPGPLSPRRTTELSGRSPGGKGSREGSDGTPSMGSSFSDLDDTSVTQSALEEAVASQMNRGAGSRFSTIGSAFRSRLSPGGNPGGNPSGSK